MSTFTDANPLSIAGRCGTRTFGFLSVAFLVACSDPAGDDAPGSSTGGALATGGSAPAGGGANGGSGGSGTAMGGSVSAGLGGLPGPGPAGSSGVTGGQTAGGMAGQATAGQATAGQSTAGQAGGTSTGGQAAGGAAGTGGQAQPGGGGSAGSAGATLGGRGGASGGGRGGSAGSGTAGAGGSNPSGCKGGKVVHFVYFVEGDQTFNQSQRDNIEKQAFAFQRYFFEQLGVTFYLNEPVVDVIEADHPASWYLTNPDGIHSDERWYRLGNIKNEVYRKLGIRNFDPNHRVVNYPTTRHDGRVGGNFGGAWMDGDDLTCMATPNGVNYPYDERNSAHCLGHVAHEFGHVLGLGHEGPMTDCMQYGFYTSSTNGAMCTFAPANVAKIKAAADNAGWLNAMPGQTCSAD